MITGAFPVEYGNRLSGVFNIDSKNPSRQRNRTSVGLSFTNLRMLSEGTFKSGDWLAVGRRGYVDLILKATGEEEDLGFSYYDVFTRVRYHLDSKTRFPVIFYEL